MLYYKFSGALSDILYFLVLTGRNCPQFPKVALVHKVIAMVFVIRISEIFILQQVLNYITLSDIQGRRWGGQLGQFAPDPTLLGAPATLSKEIEIL